MPSGYDLNADQHRFIFKALRIENAALADVNEFVVDISNGIIWLKGEDGQLHSKAAEIAGRLNELEQAGLIQSAIAFENNAKIYTMYVRDDTARIDNMLKLNKNIRYWALRGVTPDGQMKFMTGNMVNGQIENALVDVIPFTTDPNLAYPGEAQIGHLHTPSEILDGHPYYIDFFDTNRVIISTVPCQIVHVSRLDFALSPDKNIVAIEIVTTQDMVDPATSEEIGFLYQGQSIDTLGIYVYARYSNGDRRYINHDLASSRLTLQVPKDEDVDRVTIGSSFQLFAKYYTEELNTGNGEAYNDQNYASIDGSKTVKIVEDVFVGVEYIFPVPVIRTITGGVKVIKLHAFAKYQNGQFVDVTNNARLSSSNFNEESLGIIQTFVLSLGVGHAGQTFNQEGLQLNMDPALYGRWTLLDVPGSPKGTYGVPIARFDPVTNPGQIRMRLQPNEANRFANSAQFAALGEVTVSGSTITPTHFRVRSVIESGFVHTVLPVPVGEYNEFTIIDTTSVTNKLAGFASNNDGVNYPVVIEFFKWNGVTSTYDWISAVPFITQQYLLDQI